MNVVNLIQKTINSIDKFQIRYRPTAFSYAVIKKYGDDKIGYQAALLTYYGFLALFPLLLILASTISILAFNNPDLQATIIKSATNYFPGIGDQIYNHIHSLHQNGLSLLFGVLFVLYGARGVVDVFRHGVKQIWGEPPSANEPFPLGLLKSLAILFIGAFGMLSASILSGYTAAAGKGLAYQGLSVLINMIILFWLFGFLIKVSLTKQVKFKEIQLGALLAAVGLVTLQIVGGYLLARQIRHLDSLYSIFAIPLGLLFWIYLQSQVVYYSVTAAAVKSKKLWPRSFSGDN